MELYIIDRTIISILIIYTYIYIHMVRGNPSSRGYAVSTMTAGREVNREYFGGNSKAGLGHHIGMGQFASRAIVNGAAGHAASNIAGPYYPRAGELGLVPQARDLRGNKIVDSNGNKLYFPINFNNQLSGVSNPSSRYGPTRAPSDGVNNANRLRDAQSVASWNVHWPARPMRGTPNIFRSVPFSFYRVNRSTR